MNKELKKKLINRCVEVASEKLSLSPMKKRMLKLYLKSPPKLQYAVAKKILKK